MNGWVEGGGGAMRFLDFWNELSGLEKLGLGA